MDRTKLHDKRSLVGRYIANNGILFGFLLIVLLLGIFARGFFTMTNLVTILKQVSSIGIATIGVGVLIIMNCNDLSIGSMFALCGVTAGLAVSTGTGGLGLPPVFGFLAGISSGVLFGLLNGVIVSKGRIPAFIVTLGTQAIARGLALILAHGMPVGSFPAAFNFPGTASVDPVGLIPWSVIIFLAVIILMDFVMKKLPIGRYTYAIGGNREAALRAGVPVDRHIIMLYILSAMTAGLAGVLHTARFSGGAADSGDALMFTAIAAVVMGGVSLFGGAGRVAGTLVGALILAVLETGLVMINVQTFYKYIVVGIIVVVAVLMDQARDLITGRAETVA